MKRIFFIIPAFIFCCAANLVAQQKAAPVIQKYLRPEKHIFYHLKEKDGLSFNSVLSMYKDRSGFLWVGTSHGLNRFDGSHFYTYKKSNDSSSICHNSVTCLTEDNNNALWGSTEDGIFKYDIKSNKFINYVGKEKGVRPFIKNIVCAQEGGIYASSLFYGLFRFNPAKGVFENLKHDPNDPYSVTSDRTQGNCLLADKKKNGLWYASESGLNYIDLSTKKCVNFRNQPSELFSSKYVSALSYSPEGHIWMYNYNDQVMIGFDPQSYAILYRIKIKVPEGSFYCETSFEDSNGNLWLSSNSKSILLIDYKRSTEIEIVKHRPELSTSISGDIFYAALEDENHTVWMGTTGGISYYSSKNNFFQFHSFEDTQLGFAENEIITVSAENPQDSTWWIGTSAGRLIRYNPSTLLYINTDFHTLTHAPKWVSPGTLVNFFFDGDRVFLTYTLAGSYIYYLKTGKCAPNAAYVKNWQQSFGHMVAIVPETDSTWVSSYNLEFLTRWNERTGVIEKIYFQSDTLPDGRGRGTNWLVGRKGFSPRFVAASNYIGYVGNNGFLESKELKLGRALGKSGYFGHLDMDEKGDLWFSYIGQGLYHYDLETDQLEGWNSSDGLMTDQIARCIPDRLGQVWGVYHNKFSVLMNTRSDFFNFSIPLLENDHSYFSYFCLLENGNVTINIGRTLVEFFPEKINQRPIVHPPLLNWINISGKDFMASNETELRLKPQENFLTFHFGLPVPSELYPYQFECKLDGIDENWKPTGSEAIYTNLEPGTYTFRLVAVSKNNSWRSPERTLKIIIKTPYYRTWWFLGGIFLLVAGSFIGFIRFRIQSARRVNALQMRAQALEKEKALVMYDTLKQHLNPHFLFNSLTSLSSLIRIDAQQASNFLDKMSKVYRYILKNRDNETVPLHEELRFVDIYIQLQKTRFEEGLLVDIDVDEEYYHRKIAPVTLQNLVENAIKHNIADAESPLVIKIFIEGDFLFVRNNLQKKNFVETSNKQGLQSMQSLYRYLTGIPIVIIESEHFFTVKVPLK